MSDGSDALQPWSTDSELTNVFLRCSQEAVQKVDSRQLCVRVTANNTAAGYEYSDGLVVERKPLIRWLSSEVHLQCITVKKGLISCRWQ